MDAHDDDAPLSPERMLALLREQQRAVLARTAASVPWILAAWGIAWLTGFIVLWADARGHPDDAWPGPAVGLALVVLLIAAGALSAVLGARVGRGLRGTREAAVTGVAYGVTWWVGGAALVGIGQALLRLGMPEDLLLAALYPSAFVFFAGVMLVAGGLIWRAVPMAVLGAWFVVLSALGALLPPPANHLAYGVAGGGALLIAAGWSAWWLSARRGPAQAGHGGG